MDRTMRVAAGMVLAIVLVAAPATGAVAQEARTASVHLTPSRDSGVTGTAVFKDVGDGVEVGLYVRGLPEAGIEHINHVHGGATCEDDRAGRGAPATIPLKTIVADENGNGKATTALANTAVDQLFDTGKERYVLVHTEARKGEGIPPGIACADLARSADPEVAADERAPVKVMPDTGGPPVAYLFLVGAAVLALLGLMVSRPPRGGA